MGGISHAEVKVFDSVIMIGEGGDTYIPVPSTIHVYVPDCDETISLALDKGATLTRQPETFADGDRRGMVIGPQGNRWGIATHQTKNQ